MITAAEANGIGWIAWAWDDGAGGGFSMTMVTGIYNVPADLTPYGQDVVLNPTYGISVLAQPASIF